MDYKAKNKFSWNQCVPHHLESEFYDMKAFRAGKSSLQEIDIELLGDVKGKSILHLQCHFGQDTLSLARMGAEVTGMDLSGVAITTAKGLAAELDLPATFVCSDLYELPLNLTGTFDIVYTSYGTIGWLPDLKKWAEVIFKFLKPGGRFVFVEFHPVVWMFNNELTAITYSYFNVETIVEKQTGTYADPSSGKTYEFEVWNHSLAEVINNLVQAGIKLTHFAEYDYSPINCFQNTIEIKPGRWQIKGMEGKLPLVYSVLGEKE